MTSETDHPRQRTVAELLAEHGDAGSTGRRRRRREPDEAAESATAAYPAANGSTARAPERPPVEPDRSVLRDPVPREPVRRPAAPDAGPWEPRPREVPVREALPREAPPREAPPREAPLREAPLREAPLRDPGLAPRGFGVDAETTRARAAAPAPARPLDPGRDRPTDQMPRIRDARPPQPVDPSLTAPIAHQKPAAVDDDVDDADEGPPTMVGAAPVGAEAWHRERTAGRRGAAVDEGPPTQAAAPLDFDDYDDHPAGLGDLAHDEDEDDADVDVEPRRRLGRSGSSGQAWAAVLAQWVVGAIGGAALWVGFRFLWRSFPVVALAAAVLITVGLVVVVRALLRNSDTRTTVFAVLVGLLLTASPAILVLLGR